MKVEMKNTMETQVVTGPTFSSIFVGECFMVKPDCEFVYIKTTEMLSPNGDPLEDLDEGRIFNAVRLENGKHYKFDGSRLVDKVNCFKIVEDSTATSCSKSPSTSW